jgi:large subunit ribosomal protein L4
MKISVYNLEGEKVKDIELSKDIFDVESNNILLHQVYVARQANQRSAIAHTKDRSEVTGSNRKPWKQKGTGRARTGSVKNPIWRSGGTIFGPTNERNFSKKVNRKSNKKAIVIALSEKAKSKNIVVVDNFDIKEKKTKELAKGLNNLKLTGKTLLNLGVKEKDLYLYARNIENVKCIPVDTLNVMDMLNYKNVVLSEDSVKYLEKKYK